MIKIDLKKIEKLALEFLNELEQEPKRSMYVAGEGTTQEFELSNGRKAQLRIQITTDESDFNTIVTD